MEDPRRLSTLTLTLPRFITANLDRITAQDPIIYRRLLKLVPVNIPWTRLPPNRESPHGEIMTVARYRLEARPLMADGRCRQTVVVPTQPKKK